MVYMQQHRVAAWPSQGTPSPPIWVKVSVERSMNRAMKWQPIPASARDPSGTLVEVLCGQPEQKYGVRVAPLMSMTSA